MNAIRYPFRAVLPFRWEDTPLTSVATVPGILFVDTSYRSALVLKTGDGKFVVPVSENGFGWHFYSSWTALAHLKIGDGKLYLTNRVFNGKCVFEGSGKYVFWSVGENAWIYMSSLHEPIKVYNSFISTYYGDDYYIFTSFPSFSNEVTLKACDKLESEIKKKVNEAKAAADTQNMTSQQIRALEDSVRQQNSTTVTAQLAWPRYVGEGVDYNGCGKYKPATDGLGGESAPSGVVVVGVPQWKVSGTACARSVDKVNGNYTYGGLVRCDGGEWVIGTKGSSSGWWTGSEPQPGQNCTFTFTKPADSDATGSDVTLVWDKYVLGDKTLDNGYVGEIARWV